MRFSVRFILAAATLLGPLSCSRYEWVPDDELPACRNRREPASSRPLTFDQLSVPESASLRGRVVMAANQHPVPGATVVLLMNEPRTTTTDSLGAFSFAEVRAGTYVLRTRRIGYQSRTDSLHAPLASGTALVLPLDTQMLDGPCSGFAALRVRKPWWKLW
jgi:hypothetical protein